MSNPATLPDVRMPLEMGVDSRGILALLDALEADPAIEPHGIIIQRNGARIAEATGRRANPSISVCSTR